MQYRAVVYVRLVVAKHTTEDDAAEMVADALQDHELMAYVECKRIEEVPEQ